MSNTNFNNLSLFSETDQLNELPSLQNAPNSFLFIRTFNSIPYRNSLSVIGNGGDQHAMDQEDSLGIKLNSQKKGNQREKFNLEDIKISNEKFQQEDNKSSNKKRKTGCTCKKTKCLKMYCECFSTGKHCIKQCKCQQCFNLPHFQQQIEQAHRIIKSKGKIRRYCTCKKSHCQKKYCQCFNVGMKCTPECKCIDCDNQDQDHNINQKQEQIKIQMPLPNEYVKSSKSFLF